jgi:hypothetical protein
MYLENTYLLYYSWTLERQYSRGYEKGANAEKCLKVCQFLTVVYNVVFFNFNIFSGPEKADLLVGGFILTDSTQWPL